tara:strand:+ start:56 stop:355 length:300 start_codon:yes stop_codon:yes gene_type:complete
MNRIFIILQLFLNQLLWLFWVKDDSEINNIISAEFTVYILLWLSLVLANTYLLYLLFPSIKNYIESKNTILKILIFVVYIFIGVLITSAPTDLILEGTI